jgi:Tfp pilus assembly protein PilF
MKGSLSAYEKAIALDPLCYSAYGNMGNTLAKAGEVERALASYRRALEIMPGYELAHRNYVVTLLKAERLDEAWVAVRKAREQGVQMPSELIKALSEKKPEPEK